MSRIFFICFSGISLLFSIGLISFKMGEEGEVVNSKIKNIYLSDVELFVNSVAGLKAAADQFHQEKNEYKVLISSYLECRKAFKKIEYLAAYLDEQFVLDFINGAPLPKLERAAPRLIVLEPKGLQVIDEIIFGDNLQESSHELREKIAELLVKTKVFRDFQQNINLTDRKVFEAVRYGLVRLFTLGVTGFDTPGSANAIADARISMSAMGNSLNQYQSYFVDKKLALSKKISQKFEEANIFLTTNNSFNDFDRLTFLKEFIDPLYALVLEAQNYLNIETIDLVSKRKRAHNYSSKSLFAEDFLNADFYTKEPGIGNEKNLVKLGKTLFFDPILSANNERSCASCHKPGKAFTDGKVKSTAFDFKGTVKRNSPTLVNAIYSDRFFWDMRSDKPEGQFEHVIFSADEFNSSYKEIFEKLNKSEVYLQMFKEAFPNFSEDPIFKHTLSVALSAYVKSLSAFNAPFDQYVRGELADLGDDVKRGFNLFMGKAACGTCHFAPVFNGTVPPFYHESESEVLGVPRNKDKTSPVLDDDMGRFANKRTKEGASFYRNSFKTVTLRNVALTSPYMHNGVYDTLEEVVDFYNVGGGVGLGLDVPNQTLSGDSLKLTQNEKQDLIAFMKALTDTAGLSNSPLTLPEIGRNTSLNDRLVGGKY